MSAVKKSFKLYFYFQAPANIMNYYNESQGSTPAMPPMVYPPQGMVEGAVPQQGMPVNPVLMPQNNMAMTTFLAEPREMPAQQQQPCPTSAPPPVAEPEEVPQEPEVIEAKPEEVAQPNQQQQLEEVVTVEENKGPKTFASMFKTKGQSGPPPQMRTKSPIVQVKSFFGCIYFLEKY